MTHCKSIFSTAYLPPVFYFHQLLQCEEVLIEGHEMYQKQTYRNRCIIYSANGSLPLTIPVVKPNGNRTFIKDIRIDNSVKWKKEHWRALESAYTNSSFFEFIADYLVGFYEKDRLYLWDFNMELLNTLFDILDLQVNIVETDGFIKEYPNSISDFRNYISPKSPEFIKQAEQCAIPYHQVFGYKLGFIPNLSIIDLICNCGMESLNLLRG